MSINRAARIVGRSRARRARRRRQQPIGGVRNETRGHPSRHDLRTNGPPWAPDRREAEFIGPQECAGQLASRCRRDPSRRAAAGRPLLLPSLFTRTETSAADANARRGSFDRGRSLMPACATAPCYWLLHAPRVHAEQEFV